MTDVVVCPDCGAEVAPNLLACPRCRRLKHGDRLAELRDAARAAERDDELSAAIDAWHDAIELLPPGTRQATAVQAELARLADLHAARPGDAAPAKRRDGSTHAWGKAIAGVGAVGLLLWKFKFLGGFLLTKGKLLLVGLTKWSTLFSMLLAAGAYWTVFGWKFAFGLVASIYVHEMGHVAALRRYGIRASAPMFIPGIGAFVRLKQRLPSPRHDARVGLAGPIWGLATAIAAYGISLATGWASLAAIARFGAWLNLFNLFPVWQLDGGRGFNALDRRQRWIATAVLCGAWFWSEEGLLALLMLGGIGRAAFGAAPDRGDWRTLIEYALLVVALTGMCLVPVPMP